MIRKLLIALLLGLVPSLALGAGPFYVGPGGDNTNTGTSPQNRWADIAQGNAVLQPGEVLYILPGTYSATVSPGNIPNYPNPAHSTGIGGQVFYIGWSDLGDAISDTTIRKTIKIAGGTFTKSYFSVHGLTFTSGVQFGDNTTTPVRDSLVDFHMTAGAPSFYSAKYSYIIRGVYWGTTTIVNGQQLGPTDGQDVYCWGLSGEDTLRTVGKQVIAGGQNKYYTWANVHVGDRIINLNYKWSYATIIEKIDNTKIRISVTLGSNTGASDSVTRSTRPFNTCAFKFNQFNLGNGYTGSGTLDYFGMSNADSCVIERNDIHLEIDPNSSDNAPTQVCGNYGVHASIRKYNRWVLRSNRNSNVGRGILYYRDQCYSDSIVKDTIVAIGVGKLHLNLVAGGNYPGTNKNIYVDSLFYFNDTDDDFLFAQDALNSLVIQNSILITRFSKIALPLPRGKTKILHNTIVGGPGDLVKGLLDFESGMSNPPAYSDTLFCKDNIIASVPPPNVANPDYSPGPYGDVCAGGATCTYGTGNYLTFWDTKRFDNDSCDLCQLHSPDRMCLFPRLQSNYNLYWYEGIRKAAGDRSVGWDPGLFKSSMVGDSNSTTQRYLIGQGVGGYYRHWTAQYHKDSLSIMGNAGFVNSSIAVNLAKRSCTDFNPAINHGSIAINASSTGGTIGALAYVPTNPTIWIEPGYLAVDADSIFNYKTGQLGVLYVTNSAPAGSDSLTGTLAIENNCCPYYYVGTITVDNTHISLAPGQTRAYVFTIGGQVGGNGEPPDAILAYVNFTTNDIRHLSTYTTIRVEHTSGPCPGCHLEDGASGMVIDFP